MNDDAARRFATDPRENVVLEASAGAGKTSVLVQRYLNLLHAGVDPVNILAMTFTRKAAAEMRERILAELRRSAAQSQTDRARWRRLRDRLDEIAISTIDAFCLSLLREFPLEGDLDPGFAVADDTETLRLMDDALDRAVRVCAAVAREDADVALVLAQLGVERTRLGLQHLLERRLVAPAALDRFLESGPADLDATTVCARGADLLRDALAGLPRGLAPFLADGPSRHPRFAMLARDLRRLADGPPFAPEKLRSVVERLRDHFLTQQGEPRNRLHPYVRDECPSPHAYRRHRDEMRRVAPNVRDAIHRFTRDLNVVLARGVRRMFAIAVREHRAALDAHAVLDFPDLLARALTLLRQMDEFARSRYRLESRYHHVLVDEFQDTSRAQWELVSLLIQSWAEGLGLGHEAKLSPSIFVVGDRKQSIYRFRDAEVAVLDEAARYIEALRPAGQPRRSIARSYRAVSELLAFVNTVFDAIEKQDGRADAFRYDERDRFPIEPEAGTGEPALGIAAAEDVDGCSAAVADEIARLLETADVRDRTTGARRRARPGDVAILFRSRESHREFERALEQRGIPAFVYKGLGFFDADEIKDVCALIRFLAEPASNLHAAALLRSRFVRLSDEGLRRLAPDLAAALTGASAAPLARLDDEDRSVLEIARGGVRRWLRLADRVPPAELVDTVLAETAYAYELRGPRAAQAHENLKKLGGVFRRIQNRGYATLGRLAAHIDRLSLGDESNAILDAVDAVNLMTVHAAKGLEFPIVFVVNLSRGAGGIPPPIRVFSSGVHGEPAVSVGGFVSETDEDERAREREETKRLLYVALTRARDRLYLASVCKEGDAKPGRGSLGEILPPSLQALFPAVAATSEERIDWTTERGPTFSFRVCSKMRNGDSPHFARTGRTEPAADAFEPVAFEQTRRVTVTDLLRPDSPPVATGSTMDERADEKLLVGTLVHRLLRDGGDAAAVIDRARAHLTPVERATLEDPERSLARAAALCQTIREQSDILDLLERGECHYEVPFSWRPDRRRQGYGGLPKPCAKADGSTNLPTDTVVRGTIDCLVIGPDEVVTVLEFKTGTPQPWHQRQLDAYVAAARDIFRGREVRGRMVYAGL